MQAEGRRLADSAWRHHKYAGRPNPPYFNEMDSIPAKACGAGVLIMTIIFADNDTMVDCPYSCARLACSIR